MRSLILGICVAGLTVAAFAAPAPKARATRLLVASSNKSGNWEIYLVDPDTKETKNLTDHKAKDTDPVWSPDGTQIAFVSDRSGTAELWVMGADGKNPRAVSRDTAGCTWLRWSPDGKRIVFVIEKDNKKDIYAIAMATGKVTQLTGSKFSSGQPTWSPDGQKLAYSYYHELTPKWSLCTMNADGGMVQDAGGPGGGIEPAWSPDGKLIVFTSLRDDMGFRVYTCDPNGKNVRDLGTAAAPCAAAFPQWSPDGKRIAFREWDTDKGMCQVAVVGADGTRHRVLTSEAPHAHPRWSPDGKSLSYGRFEDRHGYFQERESAVLIVSDADRSNPRELLRGYGGAEWRPR